MAGDGGPAALSGFVRSPGADEDFLGPVPGSGRHVYGAAAAGDERRKAPVPGAEVSRALGNT